MVNVPIQSTAARNLMNPVSLAILPIMSHQAHLSRLAVSGLGSCRGREADPCSLQRLSKIGQARPKVSCA